MGILFVLAGVSATGSISRAAGSVPDRTRRWAGQALVLKVQKRAPCIRGAELSLRIQLCSCLFPLLVPSNAAH